MPRVLSLPEKLDAEIKRVMYSNKDVASQWIGAAVERARTALAAADMQAVADSLAELEAIK